MDTSKVAKFMVPYFLICLIAMIWPVATFVNTIEPFVMGMPFFMFWYVLLTFLIFIGCLITYKLEFSKED